MSDRGGADTLDGPLPVSATRPFAGRETLRNALILSALLMFWAFCNPFFGTDRGSLIYSARALADLDPAGIGQDIMFRLDGQSGFTVFTIVLRTLTALMGSALATSLVSAAAVLAGFFGAAALAFHVTRGRARLLAIAFAAALPTNYGGFSLFSYAEAAATPRPFAEAFVLCALAALLVRRSWLAAVLIAAAFVLHPIMALPGLVIFIIWMANEDRRWLIGVAAVALAILVATIAGIAPFDRITALVDPQWRAILVERNPHLFPSLWPQGWVGRMVARTTTILIATSFVPPRVRRLLLLALGVGLAGLAFAFWLNATLGSLVVIQAQTWRMMWIVFTLATAAAAICVTGLWARGGSARIVLALLVLAWIDADSDSAAFLFGLAAIGLHIQFGPQVYPIKPALLRGALVVLALVGAIDLVRSQMAFQDVFVGAPVDLRADARRTIALLYDYMPLAVAAGLLAVLVRPRAGLGVLAAIGMVAAVLVAGSWDQRSAADVAFDSGDGVPDLARRMQARAGEVYWIDGARESWWWLHRPQWLSAVQGAGLVFSRDLAMLYKDRAQRAIAFGLADDDILTPLTEPHEARIPTLVPDRVAAFCALPDAPAWIVAPLVDGTRLPGGLAGFEWVAPVQRLEPLEHGGGIVWARLSRYAVVACGGQLPV